MLLLHSGAGATGHATTHLVPEKILAVVYVDTGPAIGALGPDLQGEGWPLPEWDDLGENPKGVSPGKVAEWRERAVPEPAGAIRGLAEWVNEARLDIPSTVVCTSFSQQDYRSRRGYSFVKGLGELRQLAYVVEARRTGRVVRRCCKCR